MKSVIANIGMFAAVANAYSYPRHMHFRRDNGTEDAYTTLTVCTTEVQTITSCAPTVTDCPSRDHTALADLPESDKITYVVTNTIVLTSTVCPITDAGAISSSVLSEAQTGAITGTTLSAPLTASVPLSTGAYPPVTAGDESPGAPETSDLTTVTSDIVTDKTVTLTLGTGTEASIVTTTVESTIKITNTIPCPLESGSTDESTTTTTKTSTGTVTKTVQRASSTVTKTPGYSTGKGDEDDDVSPGKGDDNESGVCEDKTVTVTAPASTVYVTVGAEPTTTKGPHDSSVTEAPGSGDDDDEEDYDDDEDEDCDSTTTLEATVTVVPYPVNGTTPTGGYAAPTGFARRLR